VTPEALAAWFVGSLMAGAALGLLLHVWMARSARRLEAELLQAYGIGPESDASE
jgi:hypothetical protein